MSFDTVVIQGTLKPDRTVELDEIPTMTPGRVQVTLQPVLAGSPPKVAWPTRSRKSVSTSKHSAAGKDAQGAGPRRGSHGRSEDAYEQRMQEIWSQTQSGESTGGS